MSRKDRKRKHEVNFSVANSYQELVVIIMIIIVSVMK